MSVWCKWQQTHCPATILMSVINVTWAISYCAQCSVLTSMHMAHRQRLVTHSIFIMHDIMHCNRLQQIGKLCQWSQCTVCLVSLGHDQGSQSSYSYDNHNRIDQSHKMLLAYAKSVQQTYKPTECSVCSRRCILHFGAYVTSLYIFLFYSFPAW